MNNKNSNLTVEQKQKKLKDHQLMEKCGLEILNLIKRKKIIETTNGES